MLQLKSQTGSKRNFLGQNGGYTSPVHHTPIVKNLQSRRQWNESVM